MGYGPNSEFSSQESAKVLGSFVFWLDAAVRGHTVSATE